MIKAILFSILLTVAAHAALTTEEKTKEGVLSFYHENYKEAEPLLSDAAKAGNPQAQYHLGIMYLNGYGVPVSYQEAARLFGLSAAKNYPDAQIALGVLLIEGIGVPQNFKQAALLFTQTAKGGNLSAQNVLGWIYNYGVGVPESKIIAYALWNRVAAEGDPWARYYRNHLLREISEEELYKAQELSLDLKGLWAYLDTQKKIADRPLKGKKITVRAQRR